MRASNRAATLLVALAVLTGCQPADDPAPLRVRQPMETPARGDTLIIGLVGTMTGPGSWRGDDAFEGADLAVQLLNRLAGDDGPAFELLTLDDGGDSTRARTLIEDLAGSPRTIGIIYGGPVDALRGVEGTLASGDVPAFVLYGDLYSARRLTTHLFQSAPPLLWQARRIVPYLVRDRGYRSIGALVEDSPRGQVAWRSLRAAIPARPSAGMRVVTYEPGADDLAPALERLGRSQVEAVVVQGDPGRFVETAAALEELGAAYLGTPAARVASAPSRRARRDRVASGWWHPQVVGFDAVVAPLPDGAELTPGTVAAAAYGRGAHYLPIPELRRFRRSFVRWWDEEPLGWQQRAYEAARLLGWAAARSDTPTDDLVEVLETARDLRFGGGLVTLGPDDHTLITQPHVGLWTVPGPGDRYAARGSVPPTLPWVPLSRGFSIDGERTDIPNVEWRHLFRDPPPPEGRAPSIRRFRYAIATPRSDPLH